MMVEFPDPRLTIADMESFREARRAARKRMIRMGNTSRAEELTKQIVALTNSINRAKLEQRMATKGKWAST